MKKVFNFHATPEEKKKALDTEIKANDKSPGLITVTISPESEALYAKIEEAYNNSEMNHNRRLSSYG